MSRRPPRDGDPEVRRYGDLTLLLRLLREARPYWGHLAAIFALGLLATPIALLTPLALKIVIDSVLDSHPLPGFLEAVLPASIAGSDTGLILFAAGLFVAVAFLDQLQQIGTSVLGTYTGERLVLHFRTRLFRHVQRLSLAYHDTRGTADSVYRIQYDAPSLQYVAIYGLAPFVGATFTLAGMIYVTARIDWQLAVVALTVAPILFLLTLAARRTLRGGWREAKVLESSALSVVQEVLTGLRVVKAFGQEDREQERFAERSGAGVRKRIRLTALEGVFSLLIGLATALGTGAVLYIGARHVQQGRITTGDLVLVMAYLLQLYAPMRALSRAVTTLQSAFASAERAFSILDELPEVPELPGARPLHRASGMVEFRDVSFAYDGDRPVLHGISFEVEQGARVGISGATGAGKTTLANLLTRFYDPTAGSILIDGLDLRAYRLADLRNQFAIVLQDPVLFSTSIAENIGYARPEADFGDIIAAARAANIHDFIMSLPDGYETEVGERGMRVSGGERQRISLARAFLKDAPILILDEPTSSVDMKTEAAIMDAMERLMAGRTAFMIAHRLSTLEHCDVRLELEGGRLGSRRHETTQAEHPAVRAWRALGRSERESTPPVLETLKETTAASTYRLTGVASEPVIAKRAQRDVLALERDLYERVLPDLPAATPRYLGSTAENGNLWLFLQDAGGQQYSHTQPAHRELAAGWLALLHASAAESAPAADLPDRGPEHYRERLAAAVARMQANRGNPRLSEEDRLALDSATSLLETLAVRWAVLELMCQGHARTLVHGDFVAKNVRVRREGSGDTLLAVDWETAGWGVPAADLASLAGSAWLVRYASAARRHGLPLDDAGARALARAGIVFRYVAAFDWASQHLLHPGVERPMRKIRAYMPRLGEAMRAAGL